MITFDYLARLDSTARVINMNYPKARGSRVIDRIKGSSILETPMASSQTRDLVRHGYGRRNDANISEGGCSTGVAGDLGRWVMNFYSPIYQ